MPPPSYHEAPLVLKTPLSLIVLPGSTLEATAIRAALENFNYRVDMHWIGSRKEFLEILKGNIKTEETIILACHGDENGFLMEEEKPVSAQDIAEHAQLQKKTVMSIGRDTGTDAFADAFLKSGCARYIAPKGYPFGTAAFLFVVHVFYEMIQSKKGWKEAVEAASSYDRESEMFAMWQM